MIDFNRQRGARLQETLRTRPDDGWVTRDNSARSFVNALEYLHRLTRVMLNGTNVKSLYGDFFSTHMNWNVFGALRADLAIEIEVCPPHCHWLNPDAESMVWILKRGTRIRLRNL